MDDQLCSGTGALVAPRRGSKAALQALGGHGSALQPQGISCARPRAPPGRRWQLCFRQDGAFDHAAGLSREDAQPAAQVQCVHGVHEGCEVDVAALALRLHGHEQDPRGRGRPLGRRHARAPEAVAGRTQWPVYPLPGRARPPGATRRAVRRHSSRTRALPWEGVLTCWRASSCHISSPATPEP